MATGGTIKCVDNLIKKSGKEVSGCITVIELLDLKGRKELDFNVESIIKIWYMLLIYLGIISKVN